MEGVNTKEFHGIIPTPHGKKITYALNYNIEIITSDFLKIYGKMIN